MRICIHGSYGTGNRGDNVILSQLLLLLAAELPGAEVTLLCRDEQRVALYLQSAHPDLDLRVTPLHASFRRHPFGVLRACLRCDLFILGGGGLLWGGAPGNLAYWLTRARLARLAGARLVFYFPGVFRIKGRRAEQLLGRVSRACDFLAVRDLESRSILLRCGVPEAKILLGADPAFLIDPVDTQVARSLIETLELSGKRLIGLSARDWRQRLSAGIFAGYIRELLRDEAVVLLFFVMKTGGRLGETDADDAAVARSLLRTLPEETRDRVRIIGDRYDTPEVIALLSACDFVVAMRLHALIFATLAGTPLGAVTYDHKVRAYMEMIGRRDYLVFTDDIQESSPLFALSDKLAAERDRWPAGPVPEIALAAASLAARAQTVHRAFAEALRGWYPEAHAGGRAGGRPAP